MKHDKKSTQENTQLNTT